MSQFIEMFKDKKTNGKIADLVDTDIKSVKKSFNKDDLIEYIDISSVNAKSRTLNETTQYIVSSAPSRAQQCVQNGDILVSTVRPINRNVAVVDRDLTNLVASTGFCVLRPKDGYREYLLAIVTSDKYTDKMCDIASGGLYPAVNNSDVLSYDIFIPDKDFLNRVTQIYRQADKSGFDGRKSQFIEMFGNPVTNNKGWNTLPIKDVAPETSSLEKQTGKVWILNLDMIESNTGKVVEKVFENDSNLLSVAPFDEGNVLYSKLRPYLNKVVIPDGKGYATTELVPLRPNQKLLNLTFFSHLLRGDDFVTYANSISTGTKMPRMPLNDLRKFQCILPPMEKQNEFEEIAHQADKSGSVLQHMIAC